MIRSLKKYCFFVLLALVACKSEPKLELIPVDVFFKSQHQSQYRISPNGKYLCFLQSYNNKLNVFVREVGDTTATQLTSYTDVAVRTCMWVGDDKLLFIKDKDRSNGCSAFLMDKDGGNLKVVHHKPKTELTVIDKRVSKKGDILIALNDRDETVFDVYRLNIYTGKKVLYAKNPGNIVRWFSDGEGNVNLGLAGDGVNETIYYRRTEELPFSPVISNNFKSRLEPVGFEKNTSYIYALSNLNRDKQALVKFDCLTGKEIEVLYEQQDADIVTVGNCRLNGRPAYLTYELEKRKTHFLNVKYEEMYDSISEAIPGQEIQITDKDSLEQNFIIKTYTDKDPGAYYIYNIPQKKLAKLSEINPDIDPEKMCAMQPVSYQASDGLTIHGYLTLPLGSRTSNLPCVVLPHHGPSMRNVWAYSPEVQYLANRGYAVFQMNYRGSTGYGKKFHTAGFKQWSGKVQDDIFDGVQWLISEGIANSKQIGIFGYRFGGYTALTQIIQHPTTYKCAASYSGYINLFTYLKGFPAYYKPYKLMLNEIIGDPEVDVSYLKHSSPIFQIDNIKSPVLIAQGGKDSKVNVNETNQFVKELRKKNNTVDYVLKENETQQFRDVNNKLELYSQLEDFLNQHLQK